MNKSELIQKIKQLEGISQDERSYLIDLVNTKKKYGLVWEDKQEDVEDLFNWCRKSIWRMLLISCGLRFNNQIT